MNASAQALYHSASPEPLALASALKTLPGTPVSGLGCREALSKAEPRPWWLVADPEAASIGDYLYILW